MLDIYFPTGWYIILTDNLTYITVTYTLNFGHFFFFI